MILFFQKLQRFVKKIVPRIREADVYKRQHGSQPVIDTGVGRVLRVLQFLQREVGRGDQRLAASVTAVNHAVNLFQPVFCSSLHTEIIKYQQRVAAKAGNIFAVSYTHLDVYKRQVRGGLFFLQEQMELVHVVASCLVLGAVDCNSCLLYTSRCV